MSDIERMWIPPRYICRNPTFSDLQAKDNSQALKLSGKRTTERISCRGPSDRAIGFKHSPSSPPYTKSCKGAARRGTFGLPAQSCRQPLSFIE